MQANRETGKSWQKVQLDRLRQKAAVLRGIAAKRNIEEYAAETAETYPKRPKGPQGTDVCANPREYFDADHLDAVRVARRMVDETVRSAE